MNFDWIQTVIYLLPVATLIWKAAQTNADLKQMRKDLDELETKNIGSRKEVDTTIKDISSLLNDIRVAVARIETTMERYERMLIDAGKKQQ